MDALTPTLAASVDLLVQVLKGKCFERGLALERIWSTLLDVFDRCL